MSLYQRIFESDEHAQRLKRAADQGDPEADIAYHRHLARVGDDHAYMAPHFDRWHKAMSGSWHGPENQAGLKNSRAELVNRAAKFGRPAGVYVTRGPSGGGVFSSPGRPDDDRQDHIELVGNIHNSKGGTTTLGGLDGNLDFRSAEDAKGFHDSVAHHYPDTQLQLSKYSGWDDRNTHSVSWNHRAYLDPKKEARRKQRERSAAKGRRG